MRRLLCLPALAGLFALIPAASPQGKAPAKATPELILPASRNAYFTAEPIPMAVAGLPGGATATVEIVPQKPGADPVRFRVTGDGSTQTVTVPPFALAPNSYLLKLAGKDAGKLTITTGVRRSTMLVSQTSMVPPDGGANFILGNAFSFGILDPQGQPDRNVRGKRSPGMAFFESSVEKDLPVFVYMYWTGYLTHKPFGAEKSWAAPEMQEAMRLLNFATAQRLRRYAPLVDNVGPMDEPGLSWGKTPAGGMASGFANWDAKDWYEKRGWHYTHDPGARPDADWMKYLGIRCAIIKESYARAKADVKTVWPAATWSADLYAAHAIMDGTDPLNQQVNDVPCSHIFFDWFGGPMSAAGLIYLEKSYAPDALIAHAMNGQLEGTPAARPRPLYHLLMNQMLAAGVYSNWWLNTGAMTKDDLAAVNGPAERFGPLFKAMPPTGHEVAVLWSKTEIGLREKEVTARQAQKKTGQQIKLLIPLPEKGEMSEAEIATSAYEVGAAYENGVMDAHETIRRAGYPAHVIHEELLPSGGLKRYKVLVIVGQTHALPPEVQGAVAAFARGGGRVLVDQSTTARPDGAEVMPVDFGASAWRARQALDVRRAKAAKSKRAESVFATSLHFDEPQRKAVPAVETALAAAGARPVFTTDDPDLQAERRRAGEGELLMVLNGHEKYPDVPEDKPYPRYNYAPATAAYSLKHIPTNAVVYCIEGNDWRRVSRVSAPAAPINASFEAGEMKLYLVAPREPQGFDLAAKAGDGRLNLSARLKGVKMPWPFTLSVAAADGRKLYEVYRATGTDGTYSEALPLGRNASKAGLIVRLESPVAGLRAESRVELTGQPVTPEPVAGPVQVFDGETIRAFFGSKPEVTIAFGDPAHKALGEELAAKLKGRGIKASVRPETEVFRKHVYPRVWDPYVKVFRPTGAGKTPSGAVKATVTVATDSSGLVTAKAADGKPMENWRAASTKVTIGGDGFLDWAGNNEVAYEPGCVLYFDDKGQMSVLKGEASEVQTTPEFRARWSRPWHRLVQHVGGFQLPANLPEAYTADGHLILLGDSRGSSAVAALQASEILGQVADARYPGPGKALISFVWSPFAVEKNVILVGASDPEGLRAGINRVAELASGR